MSGKHPKHGSRPAAQATAGRGEWRVLSGAGDHKIPASSLHRGPDGSYSFRDAAGVVAEFPPGQVIAVTRQPSREPVRVTLPARFVTTPSSVAEFQGALGAAFGVQVILDPPGSKAVDAVSDPE